MQNSPKIDIRERRFFFFSKYVSTRAIPKGWLLYSYNEKSKDLAQLNIDMKRKRAVINKYDHVFLATSWRNAKRKIEQRICKTIERPKALKYADQRI